MRRVAVLAGASVALTTPLAVPALAAGEARLVIHGRGFGHGVGMSQYGALGYARRGADYSAILARYYPGTSLGTVDAGRTVRVLLRSGPRLAFRGADAAGGQALDPVRTYVVVRASGGRLELRDGDERLATLSAGSLQVTGPGPLTLLGRAANGVADGAYRGALELRASTSGVTAINALGLEDYVRGVVSGEMPASWPAAALQAQAVVARTYAITTRASRAFDHWADTRSQVYRGVAAELPATDVAVAGTSGQVVTYAGAPAVTFFFSTSGGRTEDVQNSFLGSAPRPWLRAVDDPYEPSEAALRSWTRSLRAADAQRRLSGLVRGRLKTVRVIRRGASPRIVRAQLIGTRGRTTVTGPQLKARLRLPDTWASFRMIETHAERRVAAPARRRAGAGTSGHILSTMAAVLDTRPRVAGTISSVRPGTILLLQRQVRGAWRTAALGRVDRAGRYSVAAPAPGNYRIWVRGWEGPAVTVG